MSSATFASLKMAKQSCTVDPRCTRAAARSLFFGNMKPEISSVIRLCSLLDDEEVVEDLCSRIKGFEKEMLVQCAQNLVVRMKAQFPGGYL